MNPEREKTCNQNMEERYLKCFINFKNCLYLHHKKPIMTLCVLDARPVAVPVALIRKVIKTNY